MSSVLVEAVPVPRSNFVSVLAWIFIVLSGMSVVIGALQVLMVALLFPADTFKDASNQPDFQSMPAAFQFAFQHMLLLVATVWGLSTLTFVGSIGLLRRRNWARLLFIALMLLGIAWQAAGIALQSVVFSSFPPLANAPPDFDATFRTMTLVIRIMSAAFALAMSVLFGWIARRLSSGPIRSEFA